MDNVVCRFFATSGCRDGPNCLFPHIYGDNLIHDNVCRFFMKGSCTFGKNCRFAHVIVWKGADPGYNSLNDGTPQILRIPDIYLNNFQYLTDNSMLIPFMPDLQCEILAQVLQLQEDNEGIVAEIIPGQAGFAHYHLTIKPENACSPASSEPMKVFGFDLGFEMCDFQHYQSVYAESSSGTFFNRRENFRYLELEIETSVDGKCVMNLSQIGDTRNCSFCRKIVLNKAKPGENQFGLLQNCEDVFCLKCILSWNRIGIDKKKIVYSNVDIVCPECKILSNNLISSRIWLTPQEKEILIVSYLNRSGEN